MHFFDEEKLVIATHNKGKLTEFQKLLEPYVSQVVSAAELDLPEPEETGRTFESNALIKAHAAAKMSGVPALADDSGLCVTTLKGSPGLFSARWCGPKKDPMVGMQRIHDELEEAVDRSGYFICVLALAWPDGTAETVEGRCYGHLVWPPRGDKGHGYDPMFVPEDGNGFSFGEMSAEAKDKMSHRSVAFQKIIKLFKKKEA